ncbi:MAG TPA: hypothetical protein VGR68_07195 [Actinomycetota bacterium]|jgi:hypothetical protein|nr:hypothetical protein [Actinomycetota bacterium]
MGRKHDGEEGQLPEHSHEFEHEHRSRRGRKLALLLAVAGGIAWVMRRNQRRAELDEGVWHEAPEAPTA